MRDLGLQRDRALFKPVVQCRKIGKAGHRLPNQVMDVLLDLSLLPACGRIAERRLEHVMVRHRQKARIDMPFLSASDRVNCGLHIGSNRSSRDNAEDPNPMPIGVEHHLIPLQQIRPDQKDPAV